MSGFSNPSKNFVGNTANPALTVGGVVTTTPVLGAEEFDGSRLYFTNNNNSSGRGWLESPQVIQRIVDSPAVTTNSPIQIFGRALPIEAATRYRFRLWLPKTTTFTSGTAQIAVGIIFTQVPVNGVTWDFLDISGSGLRGGLISAGSGFTNVTAAITANYSGATRIEGFVDSNLTTGGTIDFQFQMSAVGSSTVVNNGAWVEVTKVGSSATAIVAGNWA